LTSNPNHACTHTPAADIHNIAHKVGRIAVCVVQEVYPHRGILNSQFLILNS